jgi:hypothetical protein
MESAVQLAEPLQIFWDTVALVEKSEQAIIGDKKEEFELQVTSTQKELIGKLIDEYVNPENRNELIEQLISEAEKYEAPENRPDFRRRITLDLDEYVLELMNKALACSNGGRKKLKETWRELRARVEITKRRRELIHPSSAKEFEATLRWMAERGDEEDLIQLRELKHHRPYTSRDIEQLLELAEERIAVRVEDPHYVLRKGEEIYQRNKKEWDRQYVGQFIAIHQGQVVDSDQDKTKLVDRLMKAQEKKGPFRAYVVEMGAPQLSFRGPRFRVHTRRKQEKKKKPVVAEVNLQDLGWRTFRRELPQLLSEAAGSWVAFRGERQAALGASKQEIYARLLEMKCPLEEVVVRRIQPVGFPWR